jgi:site-specific DNA recombinase
VTCLVVVLPLHLVSTMNMREHWAKRARRAAEHRAVTRMALARERAWPLRLPLDVTITRIAPRDLDGDNLRGACKPSERDRRCPRARRPPRGDRVVLRAAAGQGEGVRRRGARGRAGRARGDGGMTRPVMTRWLNTHRPVSVQFCLASLALLANATHSPGMSKRAATNPRLAVCYVRCSKDEQKLSPEAQRAAVEAWAAREGVQVAAWCIDAGVCSVTPVDERPGLCAALGALREHRAGLLVVAKRDRIARDPMLTRAVEGEAARMGARVVSAAGEASGGTAPADVMMRGVVDLFAEYERGLIRARTKAALAAKAAKGERVGAVPYGYRLAADGVHVEADEAEQAVLAVVRELRAAGLSQRAIAGELAARSLQSRSGRPFGQTQVCRMLGAA